jgi:hypothetical protein
VNFEHSIILVYLALTANVALAYASSRTKILVLAAITSGLYGLYSYLEISNSGAFISLLTIANIIYQTSISDEKLEQTKTQRTLVTCTAAIIGSIIIYHSIADLFPLLAFLTTCCANSLRNQMHILKLYIIIALLWCGYGALNADMASTLTNGAMVFIFIQRIYFEKTPRKFMAFCSTFLRPTPPLFGTPKQKTRP